MAGGGSDRLVCVARSAAVRKAEKQEEAKCLIQDIHQVLGRRNDCSHLGGRCGSGESACRREMNERKGSALTAEAAFHTNFRLLGIFFSFQLSTFVVLWPHASFGLSSPSGRGQRIQPAKMTRDISLRWPSTEAKCVDEPRH